MKKTILFLVFIHNALSGQFFFHEQAYNFINQGTGSFNKILPFENGTSLAIGNYDGRAYAATLYEDGQVAQFTPFTLLNGDITFTDIIKSSSNGYVIGGICNKCNEVADASKGFLVKMSGDLKTYSQLQLLSSVIDTNVYESVLLLEKDGAIFSTYSGSLNGFGTRSHLSKHNLSDLSLVWKKQFNESFFSTPTLIGSKGSSIVIVAAGFDANVVMKVNDGGDLLSLKKYTQGNSSACLMANEDIVLSVSLPKVQRLYLIGANAEIKDSFSINTGSTFFNSTIINNYEANRILLTYPTLNTNEIPYFRFRDNIDILDVTQKFNLLASIPIPENGTLNRNFKNSLRVSEGKLYVTGNRLDGSKRPFYMVVSETPINPKAPSSFYNKVVCNDAELIIDRIQKTAPATLPFISNDIEYGNKINYKGEVEKLWFDVYRPYDHYAANSSDKRPVLIFVPGGGYTFTSENSHTILMQAAERGMIGVGLKYRVGIHPNFNGNLDSAAFYAPFFLKATYRAQQDLRDAVSFIIDHASEYNIDKENIFLAGHSAGGNMVLNYAHVNQADFEHSIISDLGTLNPAIKVKGIIPWAAPLNVLDFQTTNPNKYIQANENTPMYFIHGTCDPLAYYTNGNQTDPSSTSSIGAYNIVCKRQALVMPYKLHSIIGGEHGLELVEEEVFESMFTWIKNEVICGTPKSECITSTFTTIPPCSKIPNCPNCFESSTQEKDEGDLKVYPTISDNLYHLSRPDDYTITICDLLGNKLKVMQGYMQEFDLGLFASGLYIATIESNTKKHIFSLIKI